MRTEHRSIHRSQRFPVDNKHLSANIERNRVIVVIGLDKVIEITQLGVNLLELIIQLINFVLLNIGLLEVDLVLPLLYPLVAHQPLPVVLLPQSIHYALNGLNGLIVVVVLLLELVEQAVSKLLALYFRFLKVLLDELLDLLDLIEEVLSEHGLLLVDIVVG